MNKFSWHEAISVKDALSQVNTTVGEELYKATGNAVIFKAGGVDVLDLMKEGLVQPKKIVNIKNLPGLDQLSFGKKEGLKIGANVTLAELESSEFVQKHYPALHKAIYKAATPQLRNMATIGGNLAQRTRCWYFRSIEHPCFRKGGDRCYARHSNNGENENHAIMDNGSCVSVHASSVSTALIAFKAEVKIVNVKDETKTVKLEDFFVSPAQDISRECILLPGEMVTEILLPPSSPRMKSFYIKEGTRESYDWSTADVAVVAEMNGKRCENVIIVLGAAAPTPTRAFKAEEFLKGNLINSETAKTTAIAALDNAKPLSKNSYKIPLFHSIIQEAILKLV